MPTDTSSPRGDLADLGELPGYVGQPLGSTEWRTMEQERVDAFADVTEDHNFIHVDQDRARATPGAIAHGYFTFSLLGAVAQELVQVRDATTGINCGREIGGVTAIRGGREVEAAITMEVQGSEKPATVAECRFRSYR